MHVDVEQNIVYTQDLGRYNILSNLPAESEREREMHTHTVQCFRRRGAYSQPLVCSIFRACVCVCVCKIYTHTHTGARRVYASLSLGPRKGVTSRSSKRASRARALSPLRCAALRFKIECAIECVSASRPPAKLGPPKASPSQTNVRTPVKFLIFSLSLAGRARFESSISRARATKKKNIRQSEREGRTPRCRKECVGLT